MSALSAMEVPVTSGPEESDTAPGSPARPGRLLALVRPAPRAPNASGAAGANSAGDPRACSITADSGSGVPATQRTRLKPVVATTAPRGDPARTPVRLTRRGRMVVATLAVLALTAAVLAATLAASGGAQATSHGQARDGYRGMREIVVQPGQTLWSIASAAEPSADPRVVVQEIMSANAMTSTTISAGQLLWVPRS